MAGGGIHDRFSHGDTISASQILQNPAEQGKNQGNDMITMKQDTGDVPVP